MLSFDQIYFEKRPKLIIFKKCFRPVENPIIVNETTQAKSVTLFQGTVDCSKFWKVYGSLYKKVNPASCSIQ